MRQLLENIFAVEVPDDAKDFGCVHIYAGEDILYYPNEKGETEPIANAPCHCDQVEILFTTKDCTEEQAAGIVLNKGKAEHPYYNDYITGTGHWYAETSLKSLLRSHGLDPINKNYLLLKKIS